jgi:arsenate reductase
MRDSLQNQRPKILYLCTGNSCRSQMAEALTRQLRGDEFFAASAGVRPSGIDPRAVRAMRELNIGISAERSKDLSQMLDQSWDMVVTLCDHARESCPLFPGQAKRVHHGFDDPPYLAKSARSEEEAMSHYRRVRDEIRRMVMDLPRSLQDPA